MSKEIESPKIDQDAQNLALVTLAEVGRLREKELPKVDAQHAREDKRLLKEAVERINALKIFPTVEIIGQHAGSEQQTHTEQLLFVVTEELHDIYRRDYYLNPEGELLSYLRVGEQTENRQTASDRDYVLHTGAAFFAIEKRVKDAMHDRPGLRLIKG